MEARKRQKRKIDKWGRLPSLSYNDIKQPCWKQGCVSINGGVNVLMRADIPLEHLETKEGAKFYSELICNLMYSNYQQGTTKTHPSPFHFVMAMLSPENLHIYYYKDEYWETMQYLFRHYYAKNPEWAKYFLQREQKNFPTQLLIHNKTSWGLDTLMPSFRPHYSKVGQPPYSLRKKSHEGIMLQPIQYTFYNHAFEFARQVRWLPQYHDWQGVNKFENDKTLGYQCFEFYEKLDDLYSFFNALGIPYTTMKKLVNKKRQIQ